MIDQIDRALDMTSVIVKGVGNLSAPSPCAGWDVRDELNHLVGGMRIFAAQLDETDPGAEHESDWLGTDPQAAYALAADLDRAAWHRPDALDATVRLSFGELPGRMAALIHLTELVGHGLDLAVVSEQTGLVDEKLCEELLATLRSLDFDAYRRPGMFGPEITAPADAPAHQRLLAFLGRA